MGELEAAVVGGVLAIAGGLVAVLAGQVVAKKNWHRDTQLRASVDVLAALQALTRRLIDVARTQDLESSSGQAKVAAYHDATIGWNSATFAAMLLSRAENATLIRSLDEEVDRLLDLAVAGVWTRDEFRVERQRLGRLAAEYLNAARASAKAGLGPLPIRSIWAWDS